MADEAEDGTPAANMSWRAGEVAMRVRQRGVCYAIRWRQQRRRHHCHATLLLLVMLFALYPPPPARNAEFIGEEMKNAGTTRADRYIGNQRGSARKRR